MQEQERNETLNGIEARSVLLFKGDDSQSEEEDSYVKAFKKSGYEAQVIPTLKFCFINQETLLESLTSPDKYSSVVFTSPRSVEAVSYALARNEDCRNQIIHPWKNKLVFAVGNSTALTAEIKLGLCCIGQESGNAGELSKFIIEKLSSLSPSSELKVLLPCGNLSKDDIQTKLSEHGYEVDSVVVYETSANTAILDNLQGYLHSHNHKLPEVMVFFSPSGVKSVLPVLKTLSTELQNIRFASIGPTTSDALRKHNMRVWCQATKPNPESLIEAVCCAESEMT